MKPDLGTEELLHLEMLHLAATGGHWEATPGSGVTVYGMLIIQCSDEDARFIVAAREMVPALIDDLREVWDQAEEYVDTQEVNEDLRGDLATALEDNAELRMQLDAAEVKLERLKAGGEK